MKSEAALSIMAARMQDIARRRLDLNRGLVPPLTFDTAVPRGKLSARTLSRPLFGGVPTREITAFVRNPQDVARRSGEKTQRTVANLVVDLTISATGQLLERREVRDLKKAVYEEYTRRLSGS